MAADTFFSVDIEADGPIPGDYSMLALGLAVAGRFDGQRFQETDPSVRTFYRELCPITDKFDEAALEVAHLDRTRLLSEGSDPAEAMSDLVRWIDEEAGNDRPVLVGFPIVFDWMFVYWYLAHFSGESPFGHANALDMKTMYQQKAGVVLGRAGLDDLPSELRSSRPHTHNALDDAIEQAEIFSNLFTWDGT